jgi:hypothetical protein
MNGPPPAKPISLPSLPVSISAREAASAGEV